MKLTNDMVKEFEECLNWSAASGIAESLDYVLLQYIIKTIDANEPLNSTDDIFKVKLVRDAFMNIAKLEHRDTEES